LDFFAATTACPNFEEGSPGIPVKNADSRPPLPSEFDVP
jgi:hypothetical protein